MFVTRIEYEATSHERRARRTAAASAVTTADEAAAIANLTVRP